MKILKQTNIRLGMNTPTGRLIEFADLIDDGISTLCRWNYGGLIITETEDLILDRLATLPLATAWICHPEQFLYCQALLEAAFDEHLGPGCSRLVNRLEDRFEALLAADLGGES